MGLVVLHVMKARAQLGRRHVERRRERAADITQLADVLQAVFERKGGREPGQRGHQLLVHVRARIARHRHVIQFRGSNAALPQAIADRALGKAGAVPQSRKPLLRHRRDQLSVAHEAGSGIPVPGIDAENVHPSPVFGCSGVQVFESKASFS